VGARLRYTFRSFRGVALLRALWHGHVRRYDAEICHKCGRPVGLVWWCHDDLLWEKVTGKPKPFGSRESAGGIFCITCFDHAARKVCGWIEWAPLNLRHLQTNDEERISVEQRKAAR
jgi:hypothetical protein